MLDYIRLLKCFFDIIIFYNYVDILVSTISLNFNELIIQFQTTFIVILSELV